jgi:beta-lactamase class A
MGDTAERLAILGGALASVPGTVSIWCARLGEPPRYARAEHVAHYAASMMKLGVLAALHRRAEAGRVDLDTPVPVRNTYTSAHPGSPAYACRRDYDNDDAVWDRLGGQASLRWLAERMIVRSSNLATNLVLEHVGAPAATQAWRVAGAEHSVVARGIEDASAAAAGITNLVTAADLGALLDAVALGAQAHTAQTHSSQTSTAQTTTAQAHSARAGTTQLASPPACAAMLATLSAQEMVEDLAAGLPPGTRVAHKNGWVSGVRHAAGINCPGDAPPFVLAVCATTPLAATPPTTNRHDDEACQLVARIAATAWSDR